mmetsp:Transcript_11851/g.38975  ORF Transcript_11851/g.38975 Transcript_11851/m.38975 type:complete len:244 (+) Transcript_11851:2898-3629(+)
MCGAVGGARRRLRCSRAALSPYVGDWSVRGFVHRDERGDRVGTGELVLSRLWRTAADEPELCDGDARARFERVCAHRRATRLQHRHAARSHPLRWARHALHVPVDGARQPCGGALVLGSERRRDCAGSRDARHPDASEDWVPRGDCAAVSHPGSAALVWDCARGHPRRIVDERARLGQLCLDVVLRRRRTKCAHAARPGFVARRAARGRCHCPLRTFCSCISCSAWRRRRRFEKELCALPKRC